MQKEKIKIKIKQEYLDKIKKGGLSDKAIIVEDLNKQRIIDLFMKNIKGKKPVFEKDVNVKHDGKEGHWLEKQFGISANSSNAPDLYGYELKKDSNKITLGDYSASEYLFSEKHDKLNILNDKIINFTRTEFIKYFGMKNEEKNRYSWSGKCIPKYNIYNDCGQMLVINDNNDILVNYSYDKDTRQSKSSYKEVFLGKIIVIALWKADHLQMKIENKFNKNGFIICKKTCDTYNKICFGKAFDYVFFIDKIKNGEIIFDSGMIENNSRPYSQFRSCGKFFHDLITEEY